MYFKLSFKNIQKSMRDYAVYFCTLMIGVAVFYVFNSIDNQTVMLKINRSTSEIIDLMGTTMSAISVFVSFVLAFLVVYASRFLMKRRHQEFGIYLLLGMGKRQISLLLLMETVLVGIISLAVGLLLGIGASQLMSAYVVSLFSADMSGFRFAFSGKACASTVVYFGIMFVVVMLFQTVVISRARLLRLLQTAKRSERVKLKNPILCLLVFLVSAICLGTAYYLVTDGMERLSNANEIFIPIGLGIVGTFLLFWSVSGLLLKLVMSAKGVYYRRLNCFTLRQLSSKVNTTVFSMTIICILLFMTICILSAALSINRSLNTDLEKNVPADVQLYRKMNLDASQKGKEDYNKSKIKNSRYDILEALKLQGFDAESYLEEYVHFFQYSTDTLTFGDSMGGFLEEMKQSMPYMDFEMAENIVRLSDYNQLAELYGTESFSLQEDEYLILCNYSELLEYRNRALEAGTEISPWGRRLHPKYKECQEGFIDLSATKSNSGIVVVPDDVVEKAEPCYDQLIGNYKGDTEEEKEEAEKYFLRVMSSESEVYLRTSGNTYRDIANASIGLGALVTFVGIYLGIIFLISSAAILALKELSESVDSIGRFQMLRKLGADERMISGALFGQIGIFFLLPLLLAVVHSIFGIRFSINILAVFGTSGLLSSILMTAGVLVLIYGGYFLLTYWCSRNIIKD